MAFDANFAEEAVHKLAFSSFHITHIVFWLCLVVKDMYSVAYLFVAAL